jgi:prepilin-type processing-associated H-X9-DG protein
MNSKGLTLVEVLVLIVIVGILAAIILPGLTHHSCGGGRRSACINNLKQLGLVLNMYANENADKFPPIDNLTNNFIFESDVLYPEYLSDAAILACPSDPDTDYEKNFRLMWEYPDGTRAGSVHPDCITDMSYSYVGWMLMDDKQTEIFFEKYDTMSQEDRDADLTVPEGIGAAGGDTIHRLSVGVDQFLITDTNTIFTGDEIGASVVPIMWDQISTNIADFSHVPAGQNVLYLDGHVDFHRYDVNATYFPVSPVSAALFGGRTRDPIPDCEE